MGKSSAKRIDVGGGYSVQFTQRAKGQETPFFEALVFKGGAEVGRASNGGTGGATNIYPHKLEAELAELVLAGADVAKVERAQFKYEVGALVFDYAAIKGYARGASAYTMSDFAQDFAKAMAS